MLALDYWQLTLVVMVPALAVASYIDYSAHKVPNRLNAVIAGAGLVAQGMYFGFWDSAAHMGIGYGLLGMAVGLGVLIVPWLMGGMGGGDVKLMAAIGVWFGPWLALISFCAGALIGGVVGIAIILAGKRLPAAWANLGVIMVKMRRVETAFSDFGSVASFGSNTVLLPYGVPLSIGSLIVLAGQVFGWWSLL